MTGFGDDRPKRPQHYRRRDWIGSAIRKKTALSILWPKGDGELSPNTCSGVKGGMKAETACGGGAIER